MTQRVQFAPQTVRHDVDHVVQQSKIMTTVNENPECSAETDPGFISSPLLYSSSGACVCVCVRVHAHTRTSVCSSSSAARTLTVMQGSTKKTMDSLHSLSSLLSLLFLPPLPLSLQRALGPAQRRRLPSVWPSCSLFVSPPAVRDPLIGTLKKLLCLFILFYFIFCSG